VLNYPLDEHIPPVYRTQLLRLNEAWSIRRVGEPGAPAYGTPDPGLLLWCEENEFVLVTNNRKSMPTHLIDHLARGRHVSGIFVVDPARSATENAEALYLVAATAAPGEYQDQIVYIPFW